MIMVDRCYDHGGQEGGIWNLVHKVTNAKKREKMSVQGKIV